MNNCTNSKLRIIFRDNGSTFYRLKQEKRTRGSTDHSQVQRNKRVRMNSITPSHARNWREVVMMPDSSPIKAAGDLINSVETVGDDSDAAPREGVLNTDLSNETASILINASKSPEPLVEVLAQQTVTVDSHKEAEDNFIKRKLLKELPGIGVFMDDLDWGASVKFNKNDGDLS